MIYVYLRRAPLGHKGHHRFKIPFAGIGNCLVPEFLEIGGLLSHRLKFLGREPHGSHTLVILFPFLHIDPASKESRSLHCPRIDCSHAVLKFYFSGHVRFHHIFGNVVCQFHIPFRHVAAGEDNIEFYLFTGGIVPFP